MEGRQAIYEELTLVLKPIADRLDEYGKTDLDGILWVQARRFAKRTEKPLSWLSDALLGMRPLNTEPDNSWAPIPPFRSALLITGRKPYCSGFGHEFREMAGTCQCGNTLRTRTGAIRFVENEGIEAAMKVFEHA